MKVDRIKEAVKSRYAEVALRGVSCCGTGKSCCGISDNLEDMSRKVGYGEEELRAVPEGANLGLGCGNPVALASLKEGEVVLDLGSGAGFDAFLAATKVGKAGRVIGVDMTPEMIEKARANAARGDFTNVEFRAGEIEALPVAPDSVDAVISNCVINLSPDKHRVFREAFRVLKPGGRLMVSDLVLLKDLPEGVRRSVEAYVGCIAGAMRKEHYLAAIDSAGFQDVTVVAEDTYPVDLDSKDDIVREILDAAEINAGDVKDMAGAVASLKVSAVKPR